MTAEEFVSAVQKEILERNMNIYENLFKSISAENVKDTRLRMILLAYNTMNEEQRNAFFLMSKQVLIDTISCLFGILDGTSLVDNFRDNFFLSYGPNPEKLNGDLQDYFLSNQD